MHSLHKKNSGKHSGIPENMPKNSEIPEFQYWFGIAITSNIVALLSLLFVICLLFSINIFRFQRPCHFNFALNGGKISLSLQQH